MEGLLNWDAQNNQPLLQTGMLNPPDPLGGGGGGGDSDSNWDAQNNSLPLQTGMLKPPAPGGGGALRPKLGCSTHQLPPPQGWLRLKLGCSTHQLPSYGGGMAQTQTGMLKTTAFPSNGMLNPPALVMPLK